MTAHFDRFENRYEELVEQSIGFCGREHDFYLRAKASSLLDLARRRLGGPSSVRALDVGCGTGLLHRHLAGLAELQGVDLSQPMIATARRRNPDVPYTVAEATDLPFEQGRFELTFAVCLVHHVAPPLRARLVAELRRVTRPGGLVTIFEHNPLNPLTRLTVSRCAFDEDAVLMGRREAARLLRSSGLTIAEQRYILFFPWRSRALRRAERLLAQAPIGAQYYVAGAA